MGDHERLISALADDASPVRPPAPSARRALAWTLICLTSGWVATRALDPSWTRIGVRGLFGGLEFATSLGAGALLLIAALETSIAGRRSRALPAAALCITAWLIACAADLAGRPWPEARPGEGAFCFWFVLYACAPMSAAMIMAVRRTYAVRPVRTMLLGGGGIVFLAFALLMFCRHGRLHPVDFSMHLAAAAIVVAISVLVGPALVSIPLQGAPGPGRAWVGWRRR